MLVGLRVLVLSKSDAATQLPAGNVSYKSLQYVLLTFIHCLREVSNEFRCCFVQDSDSVDHVEYLCSGSSLALCLQGENAVKRLLEVLSSSDLSTSIVGHDTSQFYNGVYGQCPLSSEIKYQMIELIQLTGF